MRSGRGPAARVFCYAELYLSAVVLLAAVVALVAVLWIAATFVDERNRPPLWPFAVVLVGAALIAAVAYVGVVRRWHPLLRVAGYIVFAGLVVSICWGYQSRDRHPEINAGPDHLKQSAQDGISVLDARWRDGLRIVLVDDVNGGYSTHADPRVWRLEMHYGGRGRYAVRVHTTDGKTGRLRYGSLGIGGPDVRADLNDFVEEIPCGSGAVIVVKASADPLVPPRVRKLARPVNDIPLTNPAAFLANDPEVRKALRGE